MHVRVEGRRTDRGPGGGRPPAYADHVAHSANLPCDLEPVSASQSAMRLIGRRVRDADRHAVITPPADGERRLALLEHTGGSTSSSRCPRPGRIWCGRLAIARAIREVKR